MSEVINRMNNNFSKQLFENPNRWIDMPWFIIELLLKLEKMNQGPLRNFITNVQLRNIGYLQYEKWRIEDMRQHNYNRFQGIEDYVEWLHKVHDIGY